ncbi:MAG TPA: hypothetical protein VMI75_18345 [Polyangiaceae bacterium]|nr:hypothetical protein [Polyangiaceae bacterium]
MGSSGFSLSQWGALDVVFTDAAGPVESCASADSDAVFSDAGCRSELRAV